jgi:hypothetical protein
MNRTEELVFLDKAYERLPLDVFKLMLTYIPPKRPRASPTYPNGLDRQLKALQASPKRTAMDLKGLEDFVLPR